MMKRLFLTLAIVLTICSLGMGQDLAQQLQDVSVTVQAGRSEGSGVLITRNVKTTGDKVEKIKYKLESKFPWYLKAPKEVQEIVINMSYQMGVSGFSKFRKTIKYLEQGLYHKASNEMLDSLWSKQTPERSKELSDKLKKIGEK